MAMQTTFFFVIWSKKGPHEKINGSLATQDYTFCHPVDLNSKLWGNRFLKMTTIHAFKGD